IMPIWTDLTGDGAREIIVTLSDGSQGAQIVVFDENGDQIANGSPIGKGYRWRHQIAAAPFGPLGELELVDVLTPHIGGIVEFFQMVDGALLPSAQTGGFTSHTIHSRNLDMAAVGDFDGDGLIEVLLPSQDLSMLGGIHRNENGAETAWEIPVGGKLNTNLAVIQFANGTLAIGVGVQEGRLRIWLPQPIAGVN
ncbi:MAG: hypothetical protein OEZ02_11610, partial [Anaerolineae bacterium]|nr:hypothetical protein [Anaerolineae bacterium]